ncbi:hypothetical protein O181_059905 [Austropuccinia psidii MF-1]|uniref:Uncharacterized protein n=1 Tax=Austropuccinia psidii MF-1 TaxID=1389203 RepID=A0A9Q3EJC9_9BASI|nr:hypothetical protein [Austropuccinia psidii MF-1]
MLDLSVRLSSGERPHAPSSKGRKGRNYRYGYTLTDYRDHPSSTISIWILIMFQPVPGDVDPNAPIVLYCLNTHTVLLSAFRTFKLALCSATWINMLSNYSNPGSGFRAATHQGVYISTQTVLLFGGPSPRPVFQVSTGLNKPNRASVLVP